MNMLTYWRKKKNEAIQAVLVRLINDPNTITSVYGSKKYSTFLKKKRRKYEYFSVPIIWNDINYLYCWIIQFEIYVEFLLLYANIMMFTNVLSNKICLKG